MTHIVKEKRKNMRKDIHNHLLLLVVFLIVCTMCVHNLDNYALASRLKGDILSSSYYRKHTLTNAFLNQLKESENRGKEVALYFLESKKDENTEIYLEQWKHNREWKTYYDWNCAIWNDLKYFPVPASSTDSKWDVSYTDEWMAERTYGGERGHEGTDIMAAENVRGMYPVLSITDGTVTKKGWLEKGGYRIGVTSTSGAYFYYAHLDSYANIEIGDTVKAGDLLGYMGDSGYGTEGTVGKFPVHLHLGVYIYPEGEETSINPYWILKFLETDKLSFAY